LPNSKTQNNSFSYTAVFPTQQLSLHNQPQTAQTNRPFDMLFGWVVAYKPGKPL
jgi:hypothetical protein